MRKFPQFFERASQRRDTSSLLCLDDDEIVDEDVHPSSWSRGCCGTSHRYPAAVTTDVQQRLERRRTVLRRGELLHHTFRFASSMAGEVPTLVTDSRKLQIIPTGPDRDPAGKKKGGIKPCPRVNPQKTRNSSRIRTRESPLFPVSFFPCEDNK